MVEQQRQSDAPRTSAHIANEIISSFGDPMIGHLNDGFSVWSWTQNAWLNGEIVFVKTLFLQ